MYGFEAAGFSHIESGMVTYSDVISDHDSVTVKVSVDAGSFVEPVVVVYIDEYDEVSWVLYWCGTEFAGEDAGIFATYAFGFDG